MIRKKFKKIIGVALALALASNSISYTAAIKSPEEAKDYSKLIESIGEGAITAPEEKNKDFKISEDIDTKSDEMVSVIVEFVTEPTAMSYKAKSETFTLTKGKVDRDHRVFEKFINNMPSTYSTEAIEVKNSYTNVFNGVSLNIKSSDVEKLLSCGVVKRVHKDYEVTVERPVEDVTRTAEVQTEQIEPYMMDSVPYIGVDKLHEEGVKGEGIKVGVLDTGIDYNHPDITSAYQGFRAEDGDPKKQDRDKVIGWDFVDNDAEPMETTYKDWQVSNQPEISQQGNAYYTAHGTHVSGTIAGQRENLATELPVLGVAPDVDLYGYRVLGPYGSGATSGIIGAIEKAVKDGMDVINMSLGNSGNNGPFDPMVVAVNNATMAGVVTVISNGNAGPNAQTVGSPGTAPLPIAVGASTVDFNYDTYGLNLGELNLPGEVMAKDLEKSFASIENKELELVYCGLGSEEDFEGKDVTGKVAVIDRGDIALVTKVENAKKNGAALAIMINNVDSGRMAYLGEIDAANTIALSKADGEKLKENLDSKLVITSTGSTLIKGDEVTSFSSVGPVKQTYDIRPDIVAPGSQVFSTVPEYINDKNEDVDNYGIAYQRMSGTSMSAPHIAGIAALILQANPEYTPEDVKAAMMNTSEHIHQKSGESYSVHEIGAGRVNAYNAVHEDVTFKASYKVFAGEEGTQYDNVTGMLSYGKLNMPEVGEATKTIPVTIKNNTEKSKVYTLEVEYSDSYRSKNAEKNNVKIDAPETVTVEAGGSQVIDVTITAPVEAEFGNYEGFVHFTEVGNETNNYQMPFSTTIKKAGFELLDYPDMNGSSKGITGFTSSSLFNRNENLFRAYTDINVLLSINEPVEYIHAFVKDIETGEYIGHAGTEEGWWIPEGKTAIIENLVPNGRVKKIVDGKISHEEFPLESGVYELELIAENTDGSTYKQSLPMGIINDTNYDTVEFNKTPGVIEVTEDMYTKEVWYGGAEYEGIWLNANVNNGIVDKMNEEIGQNYFKQDELNTIFAMGYYPDGNAVGMGTMSKGDGNVMVAGVERADLEDGFFRVNLSYANAGKTSGVQENFILVKEDTKYLAVDTVNDKINEESGLKTSISLNNSEDVVEGKFVIENRGDAILNIDTVTPSKELQELLTLNNNNIEISFKEVNNKATDEYEISFKLTGDEIKGLNGDVKLFDINYSVKNLRGVDEDLMDDAQFRYNTIRGISGEFKNSKNEEVNIETGTMYKNIAVESKDRTLIYGTVSNMIRGVKGTKVYAVDDKGNRYEPTYMKYNEMFGDGYTFTFNNLPVIEGNYKVTAETPGALNNVMSIPGSKLNKEGERVGNTFTITGQSFLAPVGILSVIGDTNGDGAIDVVDANEVAKLYEANIPARLSENLVTDFNQDGVVDKTDMDVLLMSYMKQDLTREDSKVPEEIVDGKDIVDILEYCGYFDEIPEYNVTLNMDKESSLVGEEVTLVAAPPVDGVDFEYELSVREKGSNNWTVVQEKSDNNEFKWVSEKAGEYEFKLRIFLDEIEYMAQDNKTHTVKEIVVGKVQNLNAEATKNTAKLTWEAPKTSDGLVGYIIYKDGKEVATVDAKTTEYTAEKLRSNTNYGFKVSAKYSNGEVSKPVSENIRTKKN